MHYNYNYNHYNYNERHFLFITIFRDDINKHNSIYKINVYYGIFF